MNIEQFRTYCLQKKAVTEEFPFDETTLVFKVAGKMFALTGLDSPEFKVNLKGIPEQNIEWREEYSEIIAGYHMHKAHWNTVNFEGALSEEFLKQMIDTSYRLVVEKLSKKVRTTFGLIESVDF